MQRNRSTPSHDSPPNAFPEPSHLPSSASRADWPPFPGNEYDAYFLQTMQNEASRANWLSADALSQCPTKMPSYPNQPPAPDGMLSPLPLRGMHQLLPFRDRITPPSPPIPPEAPLPPCHIPHHNTYASLTPNYASGAPPASPAFTSYRPFMGGPNSPYGAFSSLTSSPSQHTPCTYMDSPSAASNSSYYSFDSHGTASPSIYSTPMASPAMQMGSSFPSPSRPGTSALPNLPSSRNPLAVAPTLLPTSARISVPQTITRTSKRSRSLAEYFKIGGVPGVPVRDVVKDRVVMDNPDERVLERTGVRQIHLVIAWPGYEQSGTYIRVQDRNGFITRGQLAKLVCTYISRFMGRAAKLTQTLGPEHEQWKIGKRNVTTDNLWLLSVGPAQHNIWLANLEIYQ